MFIVVTILLSIALVSSPCTAEEARSRGEYSVGPVWDRIEDRRHDIETEKSEAFPGRAESQAPKPSEYEVDEADSYLERFKRKLGTSRLDEIRAGWAVEDEELLESIKAEIERRRAVRGDRGDRAEARAGRDLLRYQGQFSEWERSRNRSWDLRERAAEIKRALQFRRRDAERTVRSLVDDPTRRVPGSGVMSRKLRKAVEEARSGDPAARRRALFEIKRLTLQDRRALEKRLKEGDARGIRRLGRETARDRGILRGRYP